ncbi:MAG TPA: hypothetical protein VHZ33_25735 [Trebonia sp.]|nr:hypothetical protein [Trebonia sp.]
MSHLIDIDLQAYEPVEDPEETEPDFPEARSTGRAGTRPGSWRNPPHPPGPVGLDIPRTRLWIKRPPGPAGLSRR